LGTRVDPCGQGNGWAQFDFITSGMGERVGYHHKKKGSNRGKGTLGCSKVGGGGTSC